MSSGIYLDVIVGSLLENESYDLFDNLAIISELSNIQNT